MTLNPKKNALAACALVALLMLSACGGGTASNTTPTATITSAAGTGGVVNFTFTFNESVGSTFNAGEVTVTGGTAAGSVVAAGTNAYTLAVTPTSGASTVTVTLPANRVTDAGGNQNTASATATYTVPASSTANITIVGTNTTPVTGENLNPPWGQATVETTAAGNVMNMTSFNYQGIDLSANPVNATGMQYLHIDFTASSITTLGVALVTDLTGTTKETAYAITSVSSSGTNHVDIPLSAYSGGTPAADLTSIGQIKLTNGADGQAGGPTAGGTLGITNMYFSASATSGSTNGTAAPAAPNITIVGTNTTPVTGEGLNPNWGQSTVETTAAGNVMNMTAFNYQGIDLSANPVNATGLQYLHIDFTETGVTTLGVALVSNLGLSNQAESPYSITSVSGANHVDIPLTAYSGGTPAANLASIGQIKLTNGPDGTTPIGGGTLGITNMYFSATSTSGSTSGQSSGSGSGSGSTASNSGGTTGTLNFMTGFQAATTIEGGAYGGDGGSSLDGYACPGSSGTTTNCGSGGSYSPAVSAAASSFYFYYQFMGTAPSGEYAGVYVFAPGVAALNASSDTVGMTLNGQTHVTFNLGLNNEFFANTNHNVAVILTLGKYYPIGTGCHLQLQTVFTPTAAASTSYSLPLSSFAVAQDCGTGTPPTGYVAALTASPAISKIDVQAASGAALFHPNLTGSLTSGANTTIANGSYIPTTLSLTGGITFQ